MSGVTAFLLERITYITSVVHDIRLMACLQSTEGFLHTPVFSVILFRHSFFLSFFLNSHSHSLFEMRSALVLSFLLPLALGCNNPANHPCAAVYTASRSSASEFCATFTASTVTATTGLPTWASACGNEVKQLSSACNCLDSTWTTTTGLVVSFSS